MRAPTISTYVNAVYRLGNITSDLQKANLTVSSPNHINEMSDDPVGLNQVLALRNSIGNLEQIGRNVTMGKSWLESSEAALREVNELIEEAKDQALRLDGPGTTEEERQNAVERMDDIIELIVALGNTQVNGNYIFAGTDTNKIPFTFDRSEPQKVVYNGNDSPFQIRTGRDSDVEVGRDGKETFWDDDIDINSTNNKIVFKEDNGHGMASEKVVTATIPEGLYTRQTLETAIKNAINEASAEQGYGATYRVSYNSEENKYDIREDGSYNGYLKTQFLWESGKDAYIGNISAGGAIDPDDVSITFDEEALKIGTPEPAGSKPFKLVWQGDDTWQIVNNPGYTIFPSTIQGTRTTVGIDLDESGTPDITITLNSPATKKGDYVEFDIAAATEDQSTGHEIGFNQFDLTLAPPVSDKPAQYITDLVITDGINDTIIFDEVDSTGGATILAIDLNTTAADITYTDMDTLAQAIEAKMEAASAAGPNGINYDVSYDSKTSRFRIRESGTDLDEFHLQWSASNAAGTIGFYPVDDATVYPASDVALDRTIVLDGTNNTFNFQEIDALGTAGTTLTATVAGGTYRNATSFAAAVEAALDAASANVPPANYDVTYNAGTNQFTIQDGSGNISELRLLFNTGSPSSDYMAKSLGYDPVLDYTGNTSYNSTADPVVMAFDNTNNRIDFSETDADGKTVAMNIQIPEGDYTSMSEVADAIQKEMRTASFNGVDYTVSYDAVEDEFVFKEGGATDIESFSMDWYSGSHATENAAHMLGFTATSDDIVRLSVSDEPVVNITIDAANNKIDFMEFDKNNPYEYPSRLTATVTAKTYTSHAELAREVEKALEAESVAKGSGIDYTVAWDEDTQKFTIKENGSRLDKFQLQWKTGDNAPVSLGGTGESIGSVLGFESGSDDIHEPMTSTREVEWGIFNSLIDFKQYLAQNDTDGIQRTIGRLQHNFDNMTSTIVDVGMKYSRLEVREAITSETNLTLDERRASIEESDIVEAVMRLQSVESAYQAALASTSKILNISLVDYLR